MSSNGVDAQLRDKLSREVLRKLRLVSGLWSCCRGSCPHLR